MVATVNCAELEYRSLSSGSRLLSKGCLQCCNSMEGGSGKSRRKKHRRKNKKERMEQQDALEVTNIEDEYDAARFEAQHASTVEGYIQSEANREEMLIQQQMDELQKMKQKTTKISDGIAIGISQLKMMRFTSLYNNWKTLPPKQQFRILSNQIN